MNIQELPIDVLLYICDFMEPKDVKSLSQTCKSFDETIPALYSHPKPQRHFNMDKWKKLKHIRDFIGFGFPLKTIFRAAEKCHTLNIIGSVFTDLTPLSIVKSLRIKSGSILNCDMTPLGNIHSLDLSECVDLKDVSMLGNVKELNLGFTNVSDVSALGCLLYTSPSPRD